MSLDALVVYLILCLEVLVCVTSRVDETPSRRMDPDGPTRTPIVPIIGNDLQPLAATLQGPNICNITFEYDGIVEETFTFIGTVKKPCGLDMVDTPACVDGYSTTTETGVGVRNVTRKMVKTIPECCVLHKKENNRCVKDIIAITSLAIILSVFAGVGVCICLCCYCCCCRGYQRRRENYGKV
ncbi:uncharacterized protein [Argopecten irradians]|uniref:uncharacterized protein isoform X2 n=1 Tax=Argopecten irradians TaxID=31199 RepID=UPI00371C272E